MGFLNNTGSTDLVGGWLFLLFFVDLIVGSRLPNLLFDEHQDYPDQGEDDEDGPEEEAASRSVVENDKIDAADNHAYSNVLYNYKSNCYGE